ncbi:MAG: DUF3846 domain-containing protein [Treponema sp.]|jgi:hypothetical protein|nr:DUF3846 domain-containing protein [Treponema sp.]
MKGILVTTAGKISVTDYSFEDFRQHLNGGYIEIVRPRRLDEKFCMLIDEDGLSRDLPMNTLGSYLYQTDIHGHPIVGDIFIVRLNGPELEGLTEKEADELLASFQQLNFVEG